MAAMLPARLPCCGYSRIRRIPCCALENKSSASVESGSWSPSVQEVYASGSSLLHAVRHRCPLGYTARCIARSPASLWFWCIFGRSCSDGDPPVPWSSLHNRIDQHQLHTSVSKIRRQSEPLVACRLCAEDDAVFAFLLHHLRDPV